MNDKYILQSESLFHNNTFTNTNGIFMTKQAARETQIEINNNLSKNQSKVHIFKITHIPAGELQ